MIRIARVLRLVGFSPGPPDEIDRILISQRPNDVHTLIPELERDPRMDRDEGRAAR